MQVIPVIDLKDGLAVHAVRGQRERYEPVRSVLSPTADPLALACALAEKLNCRRAYVADLDAIAGRGGHGAIIREMARHSGLALWVDAGVSTVEAARRLLAQGAKRIIVGSETLASLEQLRRLAAAIGTPSLILSLDLRDGRLLGGSPEIARLDPSDLATQAWEAGIRSFIVLDLARVGSATGVQTGLAVRLRQQYPQAQVVGGGGVRSADDLRELARLGFDAVLVATALHNGSITRSDLERLQAPLA
jgi:phosphoribosylformimino-5-aminoimidazole carboxamide ribotide isomerase